MTVQPLFGFEKAPVSKADLHFHHLGLAVASIEGAFPGLSPSKIIHDPIQEVKIAFVDFHGIRVELLEPVGEKSPVRSAVLKKRPLHHLCFETPDVDQSASIFEEEGRFQIAAPVPAVAFAGRRILWFMDQDIGLLELLER